MSKKSQTDDTTMCSRGSAPQAYVPASHSREELHYLYPVWKPELLTHTYTARYRRVESQLHKILPQEYSLTTTTRIIYHS